MAEDEDGVVVAVEDDDETTAGQLGRNLVACDAMPSLVSVGGAGVASRGGRDAGLAMVADRVWITMYGSKIHVAFDLVVV